MTILFFIPGFLLFDTVRGHYPMVPNGADGCLRCCPGALPKVVRQLQQQLCAVTHN
jgi:hypothetical protein